MTFTNNWFEITAKENFEKYCPKVGKALEIGAYEGRATTWIAENTDMSITVIDTFQGSKEHSNEQKHDLYNRFLDNTKHITERITTIIGKSQTKLRDIYEEFDFIYIDGSHETPDVLEDAVLAFRLLKPSGIMIFDDYEDTHIDSLNPFIAISSFLNVFRGKYTLLELNSQAVIQKL